MHIGILDIQGSVEEHFLALRECGVEPVLVKSPADLEKIEGLIIPGGESTVIGKLLKKTKLLEAIKKRATVHRANGIKPLFIWGTCAGAILLAKTILNRKPQNLGIMNIKIERNAYGRQIDSFETEIEIPSLNIKNFPAVFIRAPKMTLKNGFFKPSKNVEILASYDGEPVMAREGNLLVTMFHPELTDDTRIHRYFVRLIQSLNLVRNSHRHFLLLRNNARPHRTIHQKSVKDIAGKRQARRVIKNASKSRAGI